MKTLLATLTVFFTVMFSSIGHAETEWTAASSKADGTKLYIDLSSIKHKEGRKYVFWWDMLNYPAANSDGVRSATSYIQAECATSRYRIWTAKVFELPMAKGKPISVANIPDPKWITPTDPNDFQKLWIPKASTIF